jgi:hypothetical protein
MKKVKVIFPDGSTGEVDEKDLQAALAAGAKRFTDQPAAKTTSVTFADGSEGEIDERDYTNAVALGAVKKKESIGPGTSLRELSAIPQRGIQPSLSSPEVSEIPREYKKVLDVVSNARPKQATALYQKYIDDLSSGDEARVKTAKDDILSLQLEDNPSVITPADRQEIKRLTGVDEPRQQLEILRSRSGTVNEQGITTGMVLNPLIDTDMSKLPAVADLPVNKYIDKLDFQLNKKKDTRWSNKSVLTVGGRQTTDLEGFLNLGNPVAALNEEVKRFNGEKLNDSFSTGLESIKDIDRKRYDRIADAITANKPLPTSDVVELTSVGAKILEAQNAQSMVDRSISSDDFVSNQQAYSKDIQDNIYRHPDFLRSMMSNIISGHYERDGGVVFSKWMVTDKEIDAIPDQKFIDAGLDPNNPEFKKQKQFLKDKEGWFPFQNAIAKDDLFREFRKGAVEPLKGIASTVESVVAPEDILLINQQTAASNVAEVANRRGEYFDKNYGVWADAFNGLGQFSSQLALMVAGGSATAAAGEAIGGGSAASRLLGASKLQKLGNLLVDNKNLYSQYGVPFVQSYGDYYKDALSKGANPLQAKMMAFTNASMEGVSETFFDNIEFGKQVARDLLNKQNFDKIAKVFDRGILDDQAIKEFREGVLDVTKNTAKTFFKAGKGATKEALEEVPVALTNFVVDAAANPASVSGRDVISEMKDSFLDGLVQFSIPSLLGLGGGLRQQFKDQKRPEEALMITAMEHPYVVESINRLTQEGKLSQPEANRKIKIANTAAEQLQQLPATYSDDTELSPLDREKYLSLSVQEKILEDIASKGDKAQKAVAEKKINEITKQKELILNKGETNEQEAVSDIPAASEKTAPASQEESIANKSLFERAKTVLSTPKNDSETEAKRVEFVKQQTEETILPELVAQSIDAPSGVMNTLNGDRELATDLIAQNSEQDINKALDTYAKKSKEIPENLPIDEKDQLSEEIFTSRSLLKEGLAKKQPKVETKKAEAPVKFSWDNLSEQPSEVLKEKLENINIDLEYAGDEVESGRLRSQKQSLERILSEREAVQTTEQPPIQKDVESKKADIEKRREQELVKTFPKDVYDKVKNKIPLDEGEREFWGDAPEKINAKYDAELAELEKQAIPDQKQQPPIGDVDAVAEPAVQAAAQPSGPAVIQPSTAVASQSTRRGATVISPERQPADISVIPPAEQPPQETETRRGVTVSAPEPRTPPAPTATAATKAFADRIRRGRIDKDITFGTIPFAKDVWNEAIETVAAAVELGGELADAIAKGVDYIKNTDWYKNLSDDEKKRAERKFSKEFDKKKYKGSDRPTARVRPAGYQVDEDNKPVAPEGNFFDDKSLSVTGEAAEFLSKPTIEAATEREITQPFDYKKVDLDLMEADGKRWVDLARTVYNETPVSYALELWDQLADYKGSSAVRAVAMGSLLNSIDNDLRYKWVLSEGNRDILKNVRRDLENMIAENAREGSLTLNAQRLLYKLYHGEYKFTDAMEQVVTKDVQDKASAVVDAVKDSVTEISDTARQQHRKQKDKKPSAPPKPRKESQKKQNKGKFETASKKLDSDSVRKLKDEIRDLVKKIKC